MKRFLLTLAAGMVSMAVLSGPGATAASADSVDNPNPLKWKTVTSTKCTSKYKAKVTRGVALSDATSKKRSAKSWGPETQSAAGNLRTTRYYHNYPLKADRVTACYKGKVRHSYYPVKYQRYHISQNWKRGGLSAWIPTFSVRTPGSGYSKCYRGYRHPNTFDKISTCNGYDLDF